MNDDIFGEAFMAYQLNGDDEAIQVSIDGLPQDPLPPSYFFRKYAQMPILEKKALELATGEILDVGAAAGCHSIALQDMQKSVTALEISNKAADVCRLRGVKQVIAADFFLFKEKKFDTILLLMNGLGMGQTVDGTKKLIAHAASLLNDGGCILGDTSDITYFGEPDDNSSYFGEVFFELEWKDMQSAFEWIYPDPNLLKAICEELNLHFEIVARGKHNDFLVKIAQR